MNLFECTVSELRKMLDSKKVSAIEVLESCLDRIRILDPILNALITVTEEQAYKDAEEAQKMIDSGNGSSLTGIPYALKDNIITENIRTTCGSKILEQYIPPYDSFVSKCLKREGAVLVGKTNMDEFAMGTSTEYSAFFSTKNPWDTSCVPGGSSGGSASAVAAGMVPIAFGSDTGGSVRQPASLCGVVGMKPTYGRVSRYGLVAFSSSLDQIGPFTRNVEDNIVAFEAIKGKDEKDSTSVEHPFDSSKSRTPNLSGVRLGVPQEMLSEMLDDEIRSLFENAIKVALEKGATVDYFSAPMIEYGVSAYYVIAPAEASSNLARYDGVRYGLRVSSDSHVDMTKATRTLGFGKEVKERILIGTYVLSSGYYDAYYAKAHQVRTLMRRQFEEAFKKFDVIVCPTSPTTAFKIGERISDPLALKVLDYCTIPANIGGFPAISINAGFHNGLPVGLQIMAPRFAEDSMFSVALGFEQALALPPRLPTIETYA